MQPLASAAPDVAAIVNARTAQVRIAFMFRSQIDVVTIRWVARSFQTGPKQKRRGFCRAFSVRRARYSARNARAAYSSGSTLTSAWSWLEPTQKLTGVVELSTQTVRML